MNVGTIGNAVVEFFGGAPARPQPKDIAADLATRLNGGKSTRLSSQNVWKVATVTVRSALSEPMAVLMYRGSVPCWRVLPLRPDVGRELLPVVHLPVRRPCRPN